MSETTIVYHGSQVLPSDFELATRTAQHTAILWRPSSELLTSLPDEDFPTVLLVDRGMLHYAEELREVPINVVVVALDVESEETLANRADLSVAGSQRAESKHHLLEAACKLALSRSTVYHLSELLSQRDREFRQLSQLGIALMHEHDKEALVRLIVDQGKELTASDGGGLLILETNADGVPDLAPRIYSFDSLPDLGLPDMRFAIDHTTIVGYAAFTKRPVVVTDLHRLPLGTPFTGSVEFQRRYRYHAKSMLAVPMLDRNNAVLGVIFFINRKSDRHAMVQSKADADRYCLPYGDRELRIARTLASEAAVSIENTMLYLQIESLLESMVTAAVSAIDERDPATAGHSLRVARLTTALAEAVSRMHTGKYRDVTFTPEQMRELYYAALLHDLGKVIVREDVLLKANKLPPAMWERVDARFEVIRRTLQLEYAERHEALCRTAPDDVNAYARLDTELHARLDELDRFRDTIRRANQPTVLDGPVSDGLAEIASRTFQDAHGNTVPYLTPEELHYLEISRGSLDEEERREVEAHVTHTRRFLSQIPWTSDLKNLVRYACGHHEKLNGTGYPIGLQADEIPLETRMITLADMYDALTESDRPYKPAVSPEQAMQILRADADAGLLDSELVNLMLDSDAFHRGAAQDARAD